MAPDVFPNAIIQDVSCEFLINSTCCLACINLQNSCGTYFLCCVIQPLWSDQAKDYILSSCCLHDNQAASIIGKTKNDCFEIGIMYPNGVTCSFSWHQSLFFSRLKTFSTSLTCVQMTTDGIRNYLTGSVVLWLACHTIGICCF